jgi:uncharacterized membrane protein
MLVASRKNKHARQFVERKLIIRLRIFFVILVLLLCIIVYEMSNNYLPSSQATLAFFSGILIGAVFTRRKKIFWEEETSRVIARMDRIGIVLLIIYIVYVIFRHEWLAHLFYGHQLTALSFTLTAGTMTGRVLSMRTQIRQVLKSQKIL